MKFENVAEEWFEIKMLGKSFDYKRSVQNAIDRTNDKIGNLGIASIKPKDVDKIINSLAERNKTTGLPAGKETIKRTIQVIRAIFDFANENEYCNNNPAKNKKAPRYAPTKKRRALTDEEKNLIISTKHRAQLPAMIMMFAGLRRGEVIALKWSYIDFENSSISVDKTATKIETNKFFIKCATKNGKTRRVFMPAVLRDYLIEQKRQATSVIMTTDAGGHMHTPTTWRQMWKSYQNEMNYQCCKEHRSKFDPNGTPRVLDNITPHMLRHTCATMLWSAGVDVKTAARQLGHSDTKTTIEIYTHLESEKEMMSIDGLDVYLSKKFSQRC